MSRVEAELMLIGWAVTRLNDLTLYMLIADANSFSADVIYGDIQFWP